MARFKKTLFGGVVSAALLLGVVSCTPEQLNRIDQGIADANAVSGQVSQLTQGPAGAMMPPWVRTALELLGTAGGAAVVLWQQLRKTGLLDQLGKLTNTGKAIVTAVEMLPPEQKDAVKQAVATQMTDVAARTPGVTYDQMNGVVDQLKAGV